MVLLMGLVSPLKVLYVFDPSILSYHWANVWFY